MKFELDDPQYYLNREFSCLNDSCSARDMQSDGSYIQRKSAEIETLCVQERMVALANGRSKSALAHGKIKFRTSKYRRNRQY